MKETKSKTKGISSNAILLPFTLLIIALHALIIYLIVSINISSTDLNNNVNMMNERRSQATSLISSSSMMAETSSGFIMMPVVGNQNLNLEPLIAYMTEYTNKEHNGPILISSYEKMSDFPKDALEHLTKASEAIKNLNRVQMHSIALINSVYPIPTAIPVLSTLPEFLPELTQDELNMPEAQRLGLSKQLIADSSYVAFKGIVSSEVSETNVILKKQITDFSIEVSNKILFYRNFLYISTAIILIVEGIIFFIFYHFLVTPLNRFSRLINEDKALNQNKGVKEIRFLAKSYNELLERRDSLEEILRSAAETDSLTGLYNRYSFESFIIENKHKEISVGLLMFDVNFLKRTNDTLGHQAGDHLLIEAANCISKCFAISNDCRAYRYGGDEFAVIMKDTSLTVIHDAIKHFEQEQKNQNLSIAWGLSFTKNLTITSMKELIDDADKELYKQKMIMHKKDHYNNFSLH